MADRTCTLLRTGMRTLAVALAIILLFSSIPLSSGQPHNVVRAYHEPHEPGPNEPVTVYVELENDTEVEMIFVTQCRLSPEPYACFLPVQLTKVSENLYAGEIEGHPAGYELGYEIEVRYLNGSKENYPRPGEPVTNQTVKSKDVNGELYYYIVYEVQNGQSDGFEVGSPLLIPVIIIIVAVLILALLVRKRRKRGSGESGKQI